MTGFVATVTGAGAGASVRTQPVADSIDAGQQARQGVIVQASGAPRLSDLPVLTVSFSANSASATVAVRLPVHVGCYLAASGIQPDAASFFAAWKPITAQFQHVFKCVEWLGVPWLSLFPSACLSQAVSLLVWVVV